MNIDKEAEEKRVIRALKRLEKIWPEGLWLFSANGTLNLMRTHPDGSRNIPGEEGMDPSLKIQSFKIQNDGGDW